MTKIVETPSTEDLIDLGAASVETKGAQGPQQDGIHPQQFGDVGLHND